MIAEIHGKISSSGSNLSSRLEDQLTGDVFGALRYIDPIYGLFPILRNGCRIDGKKKKLSLCNPEIEDIEFWPWIGEAEPDILIKLIENEGQRTIIQVEVKYFSGLSSDDPVIEGSEETGSAEGEEQRIQESNNQLIRQMRSLKKVFPGHRKIQVFLTADIGYPRELFDRVLQQAINENLNQEVELYWLCWHDIPDVLKKNIIKLAGRERIVVNDLLALLERKGFSRFSKLEGSLPNIPLNLSFKEVYHTERIDLMPSVFRMIFDLKIQPMKFFYKEGKHDQ